ncbi:growth-regulating factor 4 [Dorcoceras hygrometricum]|uniref:Growth-regulating factor 4 n=1 Tax=Dorcoceras hygrometricum TaxID=472368 RepID=A0A2Z7BKS7_9LAMI|nr:growth-regulating factor 4 [Dorcoceras hygrometricum]
MCYCSSGKERRQETTMEVAQRRLWPRGEKKGIENKVKQALVAQLDTTNQSVTTPMIALDFSGTTHQSASHNVALNQILNESAIPTSSNQLSPGSLNHGRSYPEFQIQKLKRVEEVSGSTWRRQSNNTDVRVASIAKIGRPSPSTSRTAAADRRRPPSCNWTCSDQFFEVIPSVENPSSLLVQIDEGRLNPVVDLIGGSTAAYREEPDFPCDFWLEPGA